MIWFIIILGLLLRMINLGQSFWLDEAAQVLESSRPLWQQLDIRADFWPPLYHVLLHFWMWGGKSEMWIRLLSVIFGTITIWLTYLLGKEVTRSPKVAFIGPLFLAISPFHIWYSGEARPYALSVLLGILTTYFLVKKQKVAYIISSIFFLYTTYLASFLLLVHGLYIQIYFPKWIRSWLFCMVISGLAFLPWLPFLNQQLTIGRGLTQTLPGWSEAVSTPLLKSLPLVFAKFMIGRITFDNKVVYSFIVATLFALSLWWVIQGFLRKRQQTTQLFLLSSLPVIFAFLVSFFLPILAPQRVLFVLPLFYLLLATGITHLKPPYIYSLVIIIAVSFYSLYLYQTSPRFQREQWREAVQFVENTRSPQSVAVFVFPEAFAPWLWYGHGVVSAIGLAPAFTVKSEELVRFRSQLIAADRIFYFHYLTDLTDPQKLTESFIKNLGFVEKDTKDFPGVGFVTIYEKTFAFH